MTGNHLFSFIYRSSTLLPNLLVVGRCMGFIPLNILQNEIYKQSLKKDDKCHGTQ